MTPGEELRSAAAKLRARAEKTERGLRGALTEGVRDLFGNAAPDLAAMHPATARRLADLLEAVSYDPDDSALDDPHSDRHDACDGTICAPAAALRIARTLDGGNR